MLRRWHSGIKKKSIFLRIWKVGTYQMHRQREIRKTKEISKPQFIMKRLVGGLGGKKDKQKQVEERTETGSRWVLKGRTVNKNH